MHDKAALGSGADMWRTKEIGAIGAVTLVDGPHGVRAPVSMSNSSVAGSTAPATCFPPAVALSQTWSPSLVMQVGEALGRECLALGVDVLLGPGLNIKRDPRCGRNFEYFSEDPLLTGVLGAAWVDGLQSMGVGACLKHFAANNAETDRMRASSDVDVRTLREVYLRAFEHVVRQAKPWLVMCSYNRLNGTYASENEWLLTRVLRDEWGFQGVVVSDWGAVNDRVAALRAGLDLEMPGGIGTSDGDVVAAVQAGTLSEADVDRAADRVARLSADVAGRKHIPATFDIDAHHALARAAASQAIVLLKNDGDVLPLGDGSIAVIGDFAHGLVYQGGGSSHVTSTRVDVPIDEIQRMAGDHTVTYARGFTAGREPESGLHEEAVRLASKADTAIVFLGMPAGAESEGWDRQSIELPSAQLSLLREITAVQPRTVVVLSHGGVVASGAVAEHAAAVLDGALLGQAGGSALADVLFGAVNPSGRLAETVPVRMSDAPSYLNFPPDAGHVMYGERIFVGYRGYDALNRKVAFPFGHGLSYTEFEYTDPIITQDDDGITVRLTVTNVGGCRGREVVQAYADKSDSVVVRPPRWLVGFEDITLDPGEAGECHIRIGLQELAHWDVQRDRWVREGGEYLIEIGASSRDIRLAGTATVPADESHTPLTLESTLIEVLSDPVVGPDFAHFVPAGDDLPADTLGTDVLGLIGQIPIGRFASLSGGTLSAEALRDMLNRRGSTAPPSETKGVDIE